MAKRYATFARTFPRDGERHRALVRALSVWRVVDGRRYIQIAEVAREVGVCERSVRRYLTALENAGFAVPKWRYHEDVSA